MSTKGFNLLRDQLAPPTAWDKIYKWIVGTARIIIILVETIVIVAFAARIVLDFIGKNLDEEIADLDTRLGAYDLLEEEILGVQTKTSTYEGMWNNSSNISPYYNYIAQLLGSYNSDLSVSIDNSGVSINGELRVSQIDEIENDMKSRLVGEGSSEALFTEVTIGDVDSEGKTEDDLATFSISANFIQEEINRELNSINTDGN